MAIARTGVYVDDYLEYASTLPAELQRLLNTIRELDERSHYLAKHQNLLNKGCDSQPMGPKKGNGSNGNEEEEVMEKTRKDIEANQDNALNLCTEKVLLARQAYELYKLSLFGDVVFGIGSCNILVKAVKSTAYEACAKVDEVLHALGTI
ncbi:hypothetical protein Patl1_22950 [Pistacia atlantica]|uniref:Uncharacterized protein n=1 Tax=Pistacia atlantica TaxID=434234 RepID=A0ACC0ZY90_9ROSI|nr:hypothetical protein Patl1_22950 [Pistacia atlantica]